MHAITSYEFVDCYLSRPVGDCSRSSVCDNACVCIFARKESSPEIPRGRHNPSVCGERKNVAVSRHLPGVMSFSSFIISSGGVCQREREPSDSLFSSDVYVADNVWKYERCVGLCVVSVGQGGHISTPPPVAEKPGAGIFPPSGVLPFRRSLLPYVISHRGGVRCAGDSPRHLSKKAISSLP